MSKITVRADDDLVARLDALDESKSQVVREALRAYLDGDGGGSADALTAEEAIEDADGGVPGGDGEETLDDLVVDRVDELVTERLDEAFEEGVAPSAGDPQDVNVTVNVEGAAASAAEESPEGVSSDAEEGRRSPERSGRAGVEAETSCGQCGSDVAADHVYCPNCGEKATRRSFCECGDELRSDWAFCPTCGRRTPAADVLDSG